MTLKCTLPYVMITIALRMPSQVEEEFIRKQLVVESTSNINVIAVAMFIEWMPRGVINRAAHAIFLSICMSVRLPRPVDAA